MIASSDSRSLRTPALASAREDGGMYCTSKKQKKRGAEDVSPLARVTNATAGLRLLLLDVFGFPSSQDCPRQ